MDLPQGTLDLLILQALALAPQHGWAISERLHQISSETLRIRQGSLYPALHRLQRRGWIRARWGTSENNRRAKYYELTRRALTLAACGVAIGLPLAYALTRVLESALYGVVAVDTGLLGACALLLAATAAFAGYVPARRAMQADPLVALRSE